MIHLFQIAVLFAGLNAYAPSRALPIQSAPDFQSLKKTMIWTAIPRTGAISASGTVSPQSGDTVSTYYSNVTSNSTLASLIGFNALETVSGSANATSIAGAAPICNFNSSGACSFLKGSGSISANSGGGTVTDQRGAEGTCNVTSSTTTTLMSVLGEANCNTGSTITTADLLRGWLNNAQGHIVTLNGISFDGWAAPSGGGVVDNSNAININASTDIGTIRHCINSASTSASLFAGDLAMTDSSKGLILKSPNGHYWRVTVGNTGTLTTTDLGTSTP